MFGFWLYYYCDCNRVVETRPDQSTNAALATGISGALMGVGMCMGVVVAGVGL